MTEGFIDMLAGGHRNSLGRGAEVLECVLADRTRLPELFACLSEADELVRMRAGDALEKVCREHPTWLLPFAEPLLSEVGQTDQPSVRWHVVQMLQHLRRELSSEQAERATALLEPYLTESRDWIVLTVSMDVLSEWARADAGLAHRIVPELERLCGDERKAVAKRAAKCRGRLTG